MLILKDTVEVSVSKGQEEESLLNVCDLWAVWNTHYHFQTSQINMLYSILSHG